MGFLALRVLYPNHDVLMFELMQHIIQDGVGVAQLQYKAALQNTGMQHCK